MKFSITFSADKGPEILIIFLSMNLSIFKKLISLLIKSVQQFSIFKYNCKTTQFNFYQICLLIEK